MAGEELPLVVAVDCLAESAHALREALGAHATLQGTGAGWGASSAPVESLARATVVLCRSLHEVSPAALSQLRGVPAAVLLAPWEGSSEDALAAELGVRRVLRVAPPDAEERADTVLALLLSLTRRTHALSRTLARGAWLPPPAAFRGARRCAGLRLGLVGLDASTAGVVRRAAAFGMRVSFVHPVTHGEPAAHQAGGADDADALAAAAEREGAQRESSLSALLAAADAISVHCGALTDGSFAMGEAQLALLPRGACVVHTAPPAALDSAALKRALCAGALGGAAVDAPDSDAWLEAWAREAPNLIITPRLTRHSDEAYAEAAAAAGVAALQALQSLRAEK